MYFINKTIYLITSHAERLKGINYEVGFSNNSSSLMQNVISQITAKELRYWHGGA